MLVYPSPSPSCQFVQSTHHTHISPLSHSLTHSLSLAHYFVRSPPHSPSLTPSLSPSIPLSLPPSSLPLCMYCVYFVYFVYFGCQKCVSCTTKRVLYAYVLGERHNHMHPRMSLIQPILVEFMSRVCVRVCVYPSNH